MYIFRDYPSYSCPDGGKSWSRGRGETGEKEGEEKKEGEGKEGDQGNNEYSAPESSKPYRVEGGRRPLGGVVLTWADQGSSHSQSNQQMRMGAT